MLSVIGKGAFGIPLASRLIRLDAPKAHVNPPAVRRWAFGYERRGKEYAPAVKGADPAHQSLSFLEIMELLHVAAFLQIGKSWPMVREAISVARRHLQRENKSDLHPLAHHEWFADGGRLYMRLAEDIAEPNSSRAVMEAVGDAQVVLDECLRVYLRQIEFDPVTKQALRWFPGGLIGGPIVCDPQRQLGRPVTFVGGVRTDIIARHARAGDEIPFISRSYRVREHDVEAAIRFEDSLIARAA